MPFYKKDPEQILVAPNFVIGPGFELREELHEQYTYPTDGWYWANNLDEALLLLVPKTTTPTISMRQTRLILLNKNLLTAVEQQINSLPEPDKTRALIEWNYSKDVERTSELLNTIGMLVGLSQEDLDLMFEEAALL